MNRFQCLSGSSLKIIAIITMLIDHAGAIVFPQNVLLRMIGRIAFPIFCFLLVEGFTYTKDPVKYAVRLAVFALISEIPFDLAFSGRLFDPGFQNVFFTLLIGFITIMFLDRYKGSVPQTLLIFIAGVLAASLLHVDYSGGGVILIVLLYRFRGSFTGLALSIIFFSVIIVGGVEAYAVLSLIPICLYNRKRGLSLKYIFYCFYPSHLLILYLIAVYIH